MHLDSQQQTCKASVLAIRPAISQNHRSPQMSRSRLRATTAREGDGRGSRLRRPLDRRVRRLGVGPGAEAARRRHATCARNFPPLGAMRARLLRSAPAHGALHEGMRCGGRRVRGRRQRPLQARGRVGRLGGSQGAGYRTRSEHKSAWAMSNATPANGHRKSGKAWDQSEWQETRRLRKDHRKCVAFTRSTYSRNPLPLSLFFFRGKCARLAIRSPNSPHIMWWHSKRAETCMRLHAHVPRAKTRPPTPASGKPPQPPQGRLPISMGPARARASLCATSAVLLRTPLGGVRCRGDHRRASRAPRASCANHTKCHDLPRAQPKCSNVIIS